jgi:hypothetical protein
VALLPPRRGDCLPWSTMRMLCRRITTMYAPVGEIAEAGAMGRPVRPRPQASSGAPASPAASCLSATGDVPGNAPISRRDRVSSGACLLA